MIRTLRKKCKMSREQVARELSISAITVQNWEVGRTEPRASYVCALADLFGVTTDYLLGRTKEE